MITTPATIVTGIDICRFWRYHAYQRGNRIRDSFKSPSKPTNLDSIQNAPRLTAVCKALASIPTRTAVHQRRLQHNALLRVRRVLTRYLTILVATRRTRFTQAERRANRLALHYIHPIVSIQPSPEEKRATHNQERYTCHLHTPTHYHHTTSHPL